jgi:hypothetical protein
MGGRTLSAKHWAQDMWKSSRSRSRRSCSGGGKRLFDDCDETVTLQHLSLLQSAFATHITYRVVR